MVSAGNFFPPQNTTCLCSEHPVIKSWICFLKLGLRILLGLVDFSGGVKLSGFISVLFDLSSEIQSLDFVKDVSGLLNPLRSLFVSLALSPHIHTFLPAFLSVSSSPTQSPSFFTSSFLSLPLHPFFFSLSLSPRSHPEMNQTFLICH